MAAASTETEIERRATAGAILKAWGRTADRAYIHTCRALTEEAWSDACDVSLTFSHETIERGTYRKVSETKSVIETRGRVFGGHDDETRVVTPSEGAPYEVYTGAYRPTRGYWSFFGSAYRLRDALESVPREARIEFWIGLDGGSNSGCAAARLHVDEAIVAASWTRGGKSVKRQFLIDTTTGAHNSVRFGGAR